jgi:steroid delta-isomerase-like uncharacterized protein
MSERNKELVRDLIDEVWNRGEFSVVERRVAADYVGHSSTTSHGPAAYRQYFETQRVAFPDIHYTIEDEIAEGDKVLARWTARATHTGDFQGLPPTGLSGAVSGMSVFRIERDLIAECWTNLDELGMMRQLGMIPGPRPSG